MANGRRGGRQKGSVNRATRNAREAVAQLVEANVEQMSEWLAEIRKEQGAQAAWNCMVDLLEFHVPKLARTEHVGDGGGPVVIQSTREDEAL